MLKLRDKITRNVNIRKMVGVTPIGDKLRESRLRQFDHIQYRPVDVVAKKSDKITVNGNAVGEGKTETDIGCYGKK